MPVLPSRSLMVGEFQAAHWNAREKPPETAERLRELIGDKYSGRWLDLAVRIVLEDLGEDLPDRKWALFYPARHNWPALFTYWRDRRGLPSSA